MKQVYIYKFKTSTFKKNLKQQEIQDFLKVEKQAMLLRSYILLSSTMSYNLTRYFKHEERKRDILTWLNLWFAWFFWFSDPAKPTLGPQFQIF